MLWRALKNVDQGFYVDVGANDPKFLSVTHAFYERGWHGINIDPVTRTLLENERPRDVNLEVAASAVDGEMMFYDVSDSTLSTSEPQLAEQHRQSGHTVIKRTVPSMTLNQILEKHASGPIHFMNIDVEGTEMDVLRGLDLTTWRPWILLIEATIPTTQTPAFAESDRLITSSNYQFVYFDGLNRFYVAKEHPELLASFSSPPNLFDDYVFCREIDKQRDLEAKEDVIQAQSRDLQAKEKTIQAQRNELQAKEDAIRAQQNELQAKENVIQAQNGELRAREETLQKFRESYLFWISHGPLRRIPGVRLITRRPNS